MGAEIRIGKVSSVDYENGMLRVIYNDKGGSVTANMPYLRLNNEYKMPEVNESVLVGHLSNGSSRAVVIGTYWNKGNRPPEGGKGIYRKDMSQTLGKSMLRYDDKTGELIIKAPKILIKDEKESISLSDIVKRLEKLESGEK